MKALSIRQPWASLILTGEKVIETRRWKTPFRGDILLCVSQVASPDAPTFPYDHSLFGKAMCVAELNDITIFQPEDRALAKCEWYPGYSFWLRNIRPIVPFALKGKLGLFTLTPFQISLIQYVDRKTPPSA